MNRSTSIEEVAHWVPLAEVAGSIAAMERAGWTARPGERLETCTSWPKQRIWFDRPVPLVQVQATP